jgi:hypothetical protein
MNQQKNSSLNPAVEETLLALLRSTLWGQERFPFQPPQDTDWAAVYTELRHQTVHHLPVDLLVSADPENALQYIQDTAINIRKWHYLMKQQQKLCETMAHAGIPCAILKGAAAARYYPQPEHRCMGDIDLLVLPGDFDRALLQYQEPWKIKRQDPRHIDIQG